MIGVCPSNFFLFVSTWADASAAFIAAVLTYTFGYIFMHVYKSGEDVRDDTGKVYLQLSEGKKKSKQKDRSVKR